MVGDATCGIGVAQEIIARVADRLPGLDPDRIIAEAIYTAP